MSAPTVTLVLIVSQLFQMVLGHSWAECTDYQISNSADEANFNRDLCHGYPRCGAVQKTMEFGVDTGMDFHPTENGQCHCQKSNGDYSVATMAKYTRGQRVCVAFPSKNHVAASCTNPYIPAGDLQIRRSSVNPLVDPPSDGSWAKKYDLFTFDRSGNATFQHCPNFCENKDKALCTTCFQLEPDLEDGIYTFQWFWEFNPGQFYATCWEAQVSSGGVSSDITTQASPSPTIASKNVAPAVTTSVPHTDPVSTPSPEPIVQLSAPTAPLAASSGTTLTSSACKAFWEGCQNNNECAIGSTCTNSFCNPNTNGYNQCGTPNAVDQSLCGAGWVCASVNGGSYNQCVPGPKQCQ